MHFATLCGRFYAMDRDKRWDRVKEYYECLLGKAYKVPNLLEYLQKSYDENVTDEFIKAAQNENYKGMREEDGIIFINFRNDRMKQLVEVLNSKDFKEFEREKSLKIYLL